MHNANEDMRFWGALRCLSEGRVEICISDCAATVLTVDAVALLQPVPRA